MTSNIPEQKIILIGAMGAGKTTIGKILARELNWPYVDNDAEMARISGISEEELSKLPVPDLHQLEENYLLEILSRPAPYIAGAAASVIEKPQMVELLKSVTALYLYLPIDQLLTRARIGHSGVGRQALQDESAGKIITERFIRRDPLYREASQFVVELGDDPEFDATTILSKLR
jgi:shikimate kinase